MYYSYLPPFTICMHVYGWCASDLSQISIHYTWSSHTDHSLINEEVSHQTLPLKEHLPRLEMLNEWVLSQHIYTHV